MTKQTERKRGFLTRPRTRFHLAMTIWGSLILLAIILYSRREFGPTITSSTRETVTYIVVVAGLTFFAMGLTYFAWLLYVPTLGRDEEGTIAPIKLLAGAATLVPPCIIGYSLLSASFAIAPWFALLSAVIGMFALLTPHQEYLFTAQTRRAALQDVRWSTVEPRPRIRRDFSVFDYEPSTLGSTYARTVAQLDEYEEDRRYREEREPGHPTSTAIAPAPLPQRLAPTPGPVESRPTAPIQPRPSALDKLVRPADAELPARQPVAPTKPAVRKPVEQPKQVTARAVAKPRPQPRPAPVAPPEPVAEEPTPGLRRYTEDDGSDCLEGVVEAVFQPGQKRTYAHVAFDPPFEKAPEVICDIIETETESRLRTPQIFPYGARLELTRKTNIKMREVVQLGVLARQS